MDNFGGTHSEMTRCVPPNPGTTLRRSTASVSIVDLRDEWPPPASFEGLQHHWAWKMAVALCRFDFNYGDLIRWLEGEYTNAHRDWSEVSDAMNVVSSIQPPAGYPKMDFECAF